MKYTQRDLWVTRDSEDLSCYGKGLVNLYRTDEQAKLDQEQKKKKKTLEDSDYEKWNFIVISLFVQCFFILNVLSLISLVYL